MILLTQTFVNTLLLPQTKEEDYFLGAALGVMTIMIVIFLIIWSISKKDKKDK